MMSRWMALSRLQATWLSVSCSIVLSALPLHAQEAVKLCPDGRVVREAFSGDRVCVTPQTRAQVLEDNSQAETRREPTGGPWGPMTCKQGFVWRVARPDDLVCVTPDVRAKTAADNAAFAASNIGVVTPPPPRQDPFPPPVASGSMYRFGGWTSWQNQDGMVFRYRWRFDPKKPKVLDAIFELRNVSKGQWIGSVRTYDCRSGVLAHRKDLSLTSRTSLPDVILPTENCGDAVRPSVKAGIARSIRID